MSVSTLSAHSVAVSLSETQFVRPNSLDVVLALRAGAHRAGVPVHEGVSQSKDSFYGEVEPHCMLVNGRLLQCWKALVDGGALCSEVEASTIFVLSSIYRKLAGGVMLIHGEDMGDPQLTDADRAAKLALLDVHRVIKTAIEAR